MSNFASCSQLGAHGNRKFFVVTFIHFPPNMYVHTRAIIAEATEVAKNEKGKEKKI